MSRQAESIDGEELTASASASLRVRKFQRWQHSLNYNFDYIRTRTTLDSHSLSYYQPAKEAWEEIQLDSIIRLEESLADENNLLYSLLNPSLSRLRSFTHYPKWHSSFVFGSNTLNFRASLKHESLTRNDFFQLPFNYL